MAAKKTQTKKRRARAPSLAIPRKNFGTLENSQALRHFAPRRAWQSWPGLVCLAGARHNQASPGGAGPLTNHGELVMKKLIISALLFFGLSGPAGAGHYPEPVCVDRCERECYRRNISKECSFFGLFCRRVIIDSQSLSECKLGCSSGCRYSHDDDSCVKVCIDDGGFSSECHRGCEE